MRTNRPKHTFIKALANRRNGRVVTVRRTAGTGGTAGDKGRQGRLGLIVAVETETPPTAVRLAGRSSGTFGVRIPPPHRGRGSTAHMRNSRQPTPFRSAEP